MTGMQPASAGRCSRKISGRKPRRRVSPEDPDGFTRTQYLIIRELVISHIDNKTRIPISELLRRPPFQNFGYNRLKALIDREKRVERQKREVAAKREDQAKQALSEKAKEVERLEAEVKARFDQEEKLKNNIHLLSKGLIDQHQEITNKLVEIQDLENELHRLKIAVDEDRDDEARTDVIERLEVDLCRSRNDLASFQQKAAEVEIKLELAEKYHAETVQKHRESSERLRQSLFEAQQAYAALQAKAKHDAKIVSSYRRSAKIERLIKTTVEEILRHHKRPHRLEDTIMKRMRTVIVDEFREQIRNAWTNFSPARALSSLLEAWTTVRNAAAHEEHVVGNVDYDTYHLVMDVLEETFDIMRSALSGESVAFQNICQTLIDMETRTSLRPLH
ncbi:hypothetical protein PINS_up008824 [Pythium insidiosum]|nr:hypothetical protein PINS_up008824 [Pythium insidiosum]